MEDRFIVLEEELPADEYEGGDHWYIYDLVDNEVLNNEWFETEKQAYDYLNLYFEHEGIL
jgi:hypothetical protein